MRRRRAGRCLLRASAALDADVPDVAQQVLQEARALDPGHPELEEVTGRLRVASHRGGVSGGRPARQLISLGIFALLVLLLLWGVATYVP